MRKSAAVGRKVRFVRNIEFGPFMVFMGDTGTIVTAHEPRYGTFGVEVKLDAESNDPAQVAFVGGTVVVAARPAWIAPL